MSMSIPHKQLLNEEGIDDADHLGVRDETAIQAETTIRPAQSQDQAVTTVVDDPNRSEEGIPEFPIRSSIVVGWEYCRKVEGILKIFELVTKLISMLRVHTLIIGNL